MYSDAAKVVGADFEVAELTALIERALAQAEPVEAAQGEADQPRDRRVHSPTRLVSSSATSNRSATTP